MAIATTLTKLPLATFARILGLHPLHFEQIEYVQTDRSQHLCDQVMFQHPWQEGDRTAREDIARAIAEAEELIERQLGWHLIPTWEDDEWRLTQRSYQPELSVLSMGDVRGFYSGIKAKWGWLRMGGVEAKTLLGAALPITWTDADGDGLKDTGTVTATVTSGQDACEVEAYYPAKAGAAAYQIRPITVSITGVTATITFKRELCVLESLQNALTVNPVDYTVDGSFLSTVDVYRHYNDPSEQATLMWSPFNGGCGACDDSGCQLCAYSTQSACIHLRSTPKPSIVGLTPGTWDATDEVFTSADLVVCGRMPDLVKLNYQSGHIQRSGCKMEMDPIWARAVTYLAISLIDRTLCDCTANVWEYWREDLAVLSGGEQSKTYSFSARDVAANNPFGMRRGAVYAWQRVNDPDIAAVRSAMLV